jgi:hypothetical protein
MRFWRRIVMRWRSLRFRCAVCGINIATTDCECCCEWVAGSDGNVYCLDCEEEAAAGPIEGRQT